MARQPKLLDFYNTHSLTKRQDNMTTDAKVKEDIKFLLSFTPSDNPDEVPEGLAPMFYFTNTYEGDVELARKVHAIRERYDLPVDEL